MTDYCVVCGEPLRFWQRKNWIPEKGQFHMSCFDTLIEMEREELREIINKIKRR